MTKYYDVEMTEGKPGETTKGKPLETTEATARNDGLRKHNDERTENISDSRAIDKIRNYVKIHKTVNVH